MTYLDDTETKKPNHTGGWVFGASDLTRTGDLLITSEMHYRLCYTSRPLSQSIIPIIPEIVNSFLRSIQSQ